MRCLKFIALTLVVIFLQGCPTSVVIIIHNNTGDELVVELSDGYVKWPAGVSLTFDKSTNRLPWKQEGDLTIPVLILRGGTRSLSYKLLAPQQPVPSEYISFNSSGGRMQGTEAYYFQLEADENLYLVKPDSSLPARNVKLQPPGFPIEPERN